MSLLIQAYFHSHKLATQTGIKSSSTSILPSKLLVYFRLNSMQLFVRRHYWNSGLCQHGYTTEDIYLISFHLLSYRNPTATILSTADVPKYKPAPVVAYFSSRGPGAFTENILKVIYVYI